MVSIGACLMGKLPRADSTWDAVKRQLTEPSDTNRAGLEQAYSDDTKTLIALQEEADLTTLVDGSLSWDDLLKPYTERLVGVKAGGIERWYETNTFYYTPIVTERVYSDGLVLPKYVRSSLLKATGKPWAVTMISPYTYSRLAKNRHYQSPDELMFDVAEVQARDLKALSQEGCSLVEIVETEPAVRGSLNLPFSSDELEQWSEAIRRVVGGCEASTALFVCYGNAFELVPDLFDFPVDFVGFDLARTSLRGLTEYDATKGLMLGSLYSDISLPASMTDQEPNQIAQQVNTILEPIEEVREVYVTPNHELSTVSTRMEAELRVRNLGHALKILRGGA